MYMELTIVILGSEHILHWVNMEYNETFIDCIAHSIVICIFTIILALEHIRKTNVAQSHLILFVLHMHVGKNVLITAWTKQAPSKQNVM